MSGRSSGVGIGGCVVNWLGVPSGAAEASGGEEGLCVLSIRGDELGWPTLGEGLIDGVSTVDVRWEAQRAIATSASVAIRRTGRAAVRRIAAPLWDRS
jgi:hypothetical protein